MGFTDFLGGEGVCNLKVGSGVGAGLDSFQI